MAQTLSILVRSSAEAKVRLNALRKLISLAIHVGPAYYITHTWQEMAPSLNHNSDDIYHAWCWREEAGPNLGYCVKLSLHDLILGFLHAGTKWPNLNLLQKEEPACPAQNPDPNPAEHLWGDLELCIRHY